MSPVIAILAARARDLPSHDVGRAVTATGDPDRRPTGRGCPRCRRPRRGLRCRAVAVGSRWCRKGGVSAAMTRGRIHDRRPVHRG
ncbi:hypothetical protein GA0070608_4582 [Micromonospora peucetia]|uniref:Uncharacterized protein n=1 Tax=Micromonospora peucetia TaxID=47871 RepID=A0A1C6VY41_9ACTN|nr:hypothetical protein GA0070608_4582 [Micromonospora peucetia]